ncbi:MAG TPA: tetratricopeptide repeat protein [Nannocystaceae bacterium]|nr:tetratricopeptide repeat protein [Nannocystaceae bacterium]
MGDPRYEALADTPEMSSAHYHLGVALSAYGADYTAQAAFAQVLARGPSDAYFTPALRRHVDLGLASKDYVQALAELDRSLAPAGKPAVALVNEDLDERDYLAARAAQQQQQYDRALELYGTVGEKSRFRTAARYLQGVVYAERRDFRKAETAFCEVLGGKDQQSTAYYVDRRYFPVRDLAQLGLGRIAHEELRHDHAFYHYFSVPQDSDEVPHALFESAWTMAEAGEYSVARDLLAELRERFPDAPQTTEARLLDALLRLYDCDFRSAEAEFTKFIDELAPVGDHIEDIRKDPDKLMALHRELARLRSGDDLGGELDEHRLLLSMMDEDPGYARLSYQSDVLRREAGFAGALDGELARLSAKLGDTDTAARRDPEGDALAVLEEAEELRRGVAGLEEHTRQLEQAGADEAELAPLRQQTEELRGRVKTLRASASKLLLEGPPIGTAQSKDLRAALVADRRYVLALRTKTLATAERIDEQAAKVASVRLGQLARRIDDLLGEARMGRIDAVLGAKKKLEIEVRDMAAGRFPPELFGKLQIEGVVGDDEEFWPYEGEYWADEYEGYR